MTACLFAMVCVACGSAGRRGATSLLLEQAPHCPETSVLRVEGTVAGSPINDTRLENINAGLENIGSLRFYTPLTTLAPLASNQLTLDIGWANSLAYGDTAASAQGVLTLPANHPDAGKSFCITKAEVGFVDGGAEDGVFKFAVTEIFSGTSSVPYPRPCPSEPQVNAETLTVDVRGCFR